MNIGLLLGIVLIIFAGAGVALFFIFRSDNGSNKKATNAINELTEKAKEDVEHIFNDEFREELRNRGRLHFEKIIGENAMFLQQDLRLTTSQLNDFMKTEITHVLKEEFAKYEESINDAKQLAIESIEKTRSTIEQQRELLTAQLTEQLNAEKERSLNRFEDHMAEIINHYVVQAIGSQIDLTAQLEYIMNDIEQNKSAIIEDIKNGA